MRKANYIWLLWIMLIFIIGPVGATLINSYLENKQKIDINKEQIIKKDLEWVQENSYFTINMKVNDRDYEIFLVGEGERKYQLFEENELGKKDDTIIKGDFSFYLWNEEDGQVAYKQEVNLPNPMTFNLSKKNTSTFMMNQQNIVTIFQEKSANEFFAYFYTINKEKVVELSDSRMKLFSRNIKSIQQNYLQTITEEDDSNVNFETWMLEKEDRKLKKIDTTSIKNKANIKKWLEEDEYYYPFKNVTITSNMLTLAKQGMLIGTQYPIGTNIKAITKINDNYVVKEDKQNNVRVIFPEVTYYYDKQTDVVTSVAIPGVRLKDSIQSIQDVLGKPDSFVSNDNGYLVKYSAHNYELFLQLDELQMIKSIKLKKK